MATTTKTLRLSFQNGEGKSTAITLSNAMENLSSEQVKGAMTKISESNVFEKDGVPMYVQPVAANYIERTVTPVFDDSKADKAAEAKDAE